MQTLASRLLITTALILVAPAAHAAAIVDTGLSASPFPTGYGISQFQSLATRFTVAATTITDISGYFLSTSKGDVVVSIYKPADLGNVPGIRLFSKSFTTSATDSYQGISGVQWALAGGDYWLAFEALDTKTSADIQGEAPNPSGPSASNFGFSKTYTLNRFPTDLSIRISAVPEMSTWGMIIVGFGIVGASLRARRRRMVIA